MKSSRAPLAIVGALFIFCISVWGLVLAPRGGTVADIEPQFIKELLATGAASTTPLATDSSEAKVAALLAKQPAALALAAPSKTSPCTINGALPDPACSPGAVFTSATTSVICVSGYTQKVRSVSTKLKGQIYRAYGISYPQPTGTYELDHIIPLELGGNNDAANLFPEAASPKPGFKEKDVVEDYLHDEVCAGRMGLPQAQAQIASDWLAVYNNLDAATIAAIKEKFRSWAAGD